MKTTTKMKNLNNFAEEDTSSVIADCYQNGLSVACVILGFHNKNLNVLLTRFNGSDKWMLPTGLVMHTEAPEDAAFRILTNKIGMRQVNLEQFRLFGDNDRLSLDEVATIMHSHGIKKNPDNNRLVTVGYYSLVDITQTEFNTFANKELSWFSLTELPELFGDDSTIIENAFAEIRKFGYQKPIERDILPDLFTMDELKDVYEMIFQKRLDARNFERKVRSKGYIKKTTSHSDTGKARLFYFNQKNFDRRADVIFWN